MNLLKNEVIGVDFCRVIIEFDVSDKVLEVVWKTPDPIGSSESIKNLRWWKSR